MRCVARRRAGRRPGVPVPAGEYDDAPVVGLHIDYGEAVCLQSSHHFLSLSASEFLLTGLSDVVPWASMGGQIKTRGVYGERRRGCADEYVAVQADLTGQKNPIFMGVFPGLMIVRPRSVPRRQQAKRATGLSTMRRRAYASRSGWHSSSAWVSRSIWVTRARGAPQSRRRGPAAASRRRPASQTAP
jgi:hypothetical protein